MWHDPDDTARNVAIYISTQMSKHVHWYSHTRHCDTTKISCYTYRSTSNCHSNNHISQTNMSNSLHHVNSSCQLDSQMWKNLKKQFPPAEHVWLSYISVKTKHFPHPYHLCFHILFKFIPNVKVGLGQSTLFKQFLQYFKLYNLH